MRRKYIKIISLAAMIVTLQLSSLLRASNTMQISSHTAGALQVFTVRVGINNTEGFAAFQFDLPVPPGFTYIQNSLEFNLARTNGQTLQAEVLTGNKLRVVAYSPQNTLFTGDSGTIVQFQLKSGATPGTFPLTLSGAVIGDTNGINILTGTMNGSVLLQCPDISLSAGTLNFDRTPLGTSTIRTVTIFNMGNLPLNITNISINSVFFEVMGNSSFTIAAGQSSILNIRFNSVTKGQYNPTMTLISNDPDKGTWLLPLYARSYAVNELHMGNMSAYSGKEATLTCSINNMEPFTGFQFDLLVPSVLTYVTGSATLSGRKSNHLVSASVVEGNKLRVVAYSASSEVFTGTSGTVLTLKFNVAGTGGYYPLQVSEVVIGDTLSQNCISDYYPGTLNIAAPELMSGGSMDFGDVSVQSFKQLPFRLYNYGTDTLKISSITITNAAFTVLSPSTFMILPGLFSDVQIRFQQSIAGTCPGKIKVHSNDPVKPVYQVNITGKAFSPNYLFIPAMQVKNIDTVWVPVKVSNLDPFVGFQFDIDFPSFMQFLPGSEELTSRSQGHLITVNLLAPGKIRVFAYSLTQSSFTGDTGVVARFRFAVHSTDVNQVASSLDFSGAIVGNAFMQNILYQTTNGLLTIRYPHVLSGTLKYNNAANTPIDSVWLSIEENDVKLDSVRTALNGSFVFASVYDGKYRIRGRTQKPWGGVNSTDALKIQRHVVGLEPLTIPIRLTGADVNNTGYINATDAVKIKMRFVGLDTAFAKSDWLFEKTTGSDSVIMGTSGTVVNLYGLCTGDVNGSNVPATGSKSGQESEIITENVVSANTGCQVFLPVSIDHDCEMGAFSLIADFPSEMATIEEVSFVYGKPFYSVSGNRLKVVWSEVDGIKVRSKEPFAFIKLKTTALFGSGKMMRFRNTSMLTELADASGNLMEEARIMIPSLVFDGSDPGSSMTIYPNPATDRAFLFFTAEGAGTTTVSLFDMLGRCVKVNGPVLTLPGLNKIDLDVSQLHKNIYQVFVESDSGNQHIKEIKRLVAGHE